MYGVIFPQKKRVKPSFSCTIILLVLNIFVPNNLLGPGTNFKNFHTLRTFTLNVPLKLLFSHTRNKNEPSVHLSEYVMVE